MALKTLGTNTTTILKAVKFIPGMSDSDVADFNALALVPGNINPSRQVVPGALSKSGLLLIGGRVDSGVQLQPGDWAVVDPVSGCVFCIPNSALPTTLTATGDTATTTAVTNLSTNVLALGWCVGMPIKSSNSDIPALAYIAAIASDGLSLTLSAAATGTNVGGTLTASNFTHS